MSWQSDVWAALRKLAGLRLTYQTPTLITQAEPGRLTLLAGVEGKVARLHELVVGANPAGTFYLAYDDDGDGANEVALSGAYPVAANVPFILPFKAHPDACLKTLAGKYLTLVSTGAKLFGHAITSSGK